MSSVKKSFSVSPDKSCRDSSERTSTQAGGDKQQKPALACTGSIPGLAFLDTVNKACANRPELYLPAIRNKCTSLSKLDRAGCETAILAGNCIICQEKHIYKQCPILKGILPIGFKSTMKQVSYD